ncbi:MAG TPA: hypothetical protein VHI78_14035 [Bacteroidales bacterium]|jgi:hypothetical protein|nr:hypothetical protein [Bacteroidales bacterium]
MAIELEIKDGTPWYLSTDVWVVSDPSDTTESMPIVGVPCFLKARVSNNGTTGVTNATVKFYWANPSIGFNRNTANYIGQAFVSLTSGAIQDVLCLIPWVPVYLNDGHECLLAEAFHSNDPLPQSPDFNVPIDRHVAQRNLSVVNALKSVFHFNFEMHNNQRKQRKFNVNVVQIRLEKLLGNFPLIEKKFDLKNRKEGKLKSYFFSDSRWPNENLKGREIKQNDFDLPGFGKKHLAIAGQIEGDFVFLTITQNEDKFETGGLGILVINL